MRPCQLYSKFLSCSNGAKSGRCDNGDLEPECEKIVYWTHDGEISSFFANARLCAMLLGCLFDLIQRYALTDCHLSHSRYPRATVEPSIRVFFSWFLSPSCSLFNAYSFFSLGQVFRFHFNGHLTTTGLARSCRHRCVPNSVHPRARNTT